VCFELRLLDLACLVILSRPPLFWERGLFCYWWMHLVCYCLKSIVRFGFVRWYVVIWFVLSLQVEVGLPLCSV